MDQSYSEQYGINPLDPTVGITAESGSLNGTRTTTETTTKVAGEYSTEAIPSGTATAFESTTFVGSSEPSTYNWDYDFADPDGLQPLNFCLLGDATEQFLSDKEARTVYSTQRGELYTFYGLYGLYAMSGPINNSKTVKLSKLYTDEQLIKDLTDKFVAASWSTPGEYDNLSANFLWNNTSITQLRPDHASAGMKDAKYRLVSNVIGGIPQTTVVKFIWKEVFSPQEGEGGEIGVKWIEDVGIPVTSGVQAGQFATKVGELKHPDKPGSIIPDYNRYGISAPGELAALNDGETRRLTRPYTDSKGNKKTEESIQRGKPITFQLDLLDQQYSPTLTATPSGAVTLWEREKDDKWKEHPLPFKIPFEQVAGPASDPGRYMIQGITPGTVTLQITANGAVRDETDIEVLRVDLDVDSDNLNMVEQSNSEELIEEDSSQPGKILLGGDAMESDANGIPLHPGKLTSLKLQTANLPTWATITLRYPDKALKIWKTPPGSTPAQGDLILPNTEYDVAEIGGHLSIQSLGTAAGLATIAVTSGGISGEITDEVFVRLLSVDMEPDANMAGVIGDIVKSAKVDSTIKHFVTPQKSAELNQDYVILKAVGVTAEQITSGNPMEIVEWDGGEAVPNEPLKRRVKRDATGNGPTEVTIKIKQGGQIASQMDIWVVWADSTAVNTGKARFSSSFGAAFEKTIGGILTDIATFDGLRTPLWRFAFTIQPSSIITGLSAGQDVPDLSGKLPPNTQVPGDNGVHQVLGPYVQGGSGGKFKFGASHYWDVSRQMQVTIHNPDLIPQNDFSENMGDLYSTQPQASSIPIPFPSDPVMGNDDVGDDGNPSRIAGDESNDPYVADTNADLSHPIGQIVSVDAPRSQITVAAGAENREYRELDEFREFVRLKLPGGWYRVSDYVNWRFDLKAKFTGGQWRDNGCSPVPTP